jgi:hypothetical protein
VLPDSGAGRGKAKAQIDLLSRSAATHAAAAHSACSWMAASTTCYKATSPLLIINCTFYSYTVVPRETLRAVRPPQISGVGS